MPAQNLFTRRILGYRTRLLYAKLGVLSIISNNFGTEKVIKMAEHVPYTKHDYIGNITRLYLIIVHNVQLLCRDSAKQTGEGIKNSYTSGLEQSTDGGQ